MMTIAASGFTKMNLVRSFLLVQHQKVSRRFQLWIACNGYVNKESVLFIDELESALHPDAICDFLDMISYISHEMGIQVFISTHSYFVIKKLYLIALKYPDEVACISLAKGKEPQVCNQRWNAGKLYHSSIDRPLQARSCRGAVMGVIIEESGLRFGEYHENQVFQIETSEQYTKSLRQNGIKTCEFILRKGEKLYFFEAKQSCPRQIMKDIPDNEKEEKKKRYDEFIQEIVLKMRHSLSLYGNILLKQYSQDKVPEKLVNPDLSKTQISLVLVINPQEGDWEPEPELRDDLQLHLKDEMKIWKIRSLFVITPQQARKKHFII